MTYLIANIANAAPKYSWDACDRLPEKDRPSYLHENRASAEVEMLRLAKLIPDGHFVLFQAVAVAEVKVMERVIHERVAFVEPLQ